MSFVNSVDLIGDEALAAKIIDRTLTEIADSAITSIGEYAFSNCPNLTAADFLSATSIKYRVFEGCTNLTVLILRCGTVCTITDVNVFMDSQIKSGGIGYVYVPASLVDAYKSATNWSSLANQIRAIEDYPEICGG